MYKGQISAYVKKRDEDLKKMIEAANDHWGRLDILINNAYAAADGQQGGALEVTEERWESDIRALVTSVYAGSKYAIPLTVSYTHLTLPTNREV